MLYGIHLYKSGEFDSALTQYKAAEKMQPESAEIHYNLGLLYYHKKEYDSAERHARKAYSLGYPLPGLRAKLIESGVWSDSTQ
jgi:Flp pilus assembly protein TadD